MFAPTSLRFALLLLAAGTATGCASGPQLTAGEPTRLALAQGDNQLTLTLVNKSAADKVRREKPKDGALYEAKTSDPGRKFMDDVELQAVIDAFGAAGLLASGTPTPAPGAIDVVMLECSGQRWCWSRRLRGMQASERPFHEARNLFMAAYNSVTAWHGTSTERGDLRSEDQKARDARDEALRRRQRESEFPR
jgi:hypothetical protein